jgi:hypothetical protein
MSDRNLMCFTRYLVSSLLQWKRRITGILAHKRYVFFSSMFKVDASVILWLEI